MEFQGQTEAIVSALKSVLAGHSSASLHEPEFRGNEWAYVKDCIDTGWVSSVGSYVDQFENMLVEYTGTGYAVSTVNGTAALHIALLLSGVKPEDEVLVPSMTFVATVNAIAYIGAKPHFIDSDLSNLSIDLIALESYLNEIAEVNNGHCINRVSGRVMRALVVMHTFGHIGDMDDLTVLANKWNILIIEDGAESLGSTYKGRHAGNFGRLGILSFNGNKTITTGGGGAILTNDPDLAARAKHLTTTAKLPHKWSFNHNEIAYNYRLPNINAALGCAQLERLDDMLVRKRTLAQRYITALKGISGASILAAPANSTSNYWLITVLLDKEISSARDIILAALNDASLMSRPVWTLMNKLPMYAQCQAMPLPNANSLEARLINVPSSPKLADVMS